jgi:spore germination cell wall hydrolase CwlJ-like protein
MKLKNKFSLVVFSLLLICVSILNPITTSFAEDIIVKQVNTVFNQEEQCLAENIYYESASESFEGKLAVAQVTINRVRSGKFADSICGVVHQKNEVNGSMVCQFSWFCQSIRNMVKNKYQWEESQIVARKALTEAIAHETLYHQNALYYHANYINPGWKHTKVAQIGNHIFYTR